VEAAIADGEDGGSGRGVIGVGEDGVHRDILRLVGGGRVGFSLP
jgi:hypothetical protein